MFQYLSANLTTLKLIAVCTGDEDTDNYNDIPIAWLKEKVSEIAFLKRRNIDKYGLEWSEAVKQAINDYAGENWNGMG